MIGRNEMALDFFDIPKNTQPQCIHEKNIRLIPTERHPTKYWISSPQNVQGHQKKKKRKSLRNCQAKVT